MAPDIRGISDHFEIRGRFQEGRPYGGGHINDTILLTHRLDGCPVRTILQRVNHHVFKEPAKVMDNIGRVTRHLRQRLAAEGCQDLSRRVLTLIPTRDGTSSYQDPEGNTWRVFVYIEDTVTVEVPQSLDPIFQAAKAFGRFLSLLSDLPAPPLHETIVRFHDGMRRHRSFQEVVAADPCGRVALVSSEIAYVEAHAAILSLPAELLAQGRIPVRVTHNDTKVNNVLLDAATGEGLAVIDLDTVMPGLVLYDVGDIVRTAAGTATEDEPDLSKVDLRLDRFQSIAAGFLAGAGCALNHCEVEHLAVAGQFMTFSQAVRFLTDYLQGDTYYKIHRPEHNLDRCRTQFRLVQHMIDRQDQMEEIVRRIAASVPE
jgi:aminoglycoside phosphotransferase (APT) family kinase protein